MADDGGYGTTLDGIAFLVSAQIMADIVAKACSSPQTTEINSGKRAATLMKWVSLGLAEGAGFVIIAALISPRCGAAFLAGGLLEGVITYAEYAHARKAGLASSAPGTES